MPIENEYRQAEIGSGKQEDRKKSASHTEQPHEKRLFPKHSQSDKKAPMRIITTQSTIADGLNKTDLTSPEAIKRRDRGEESKAEIGRSYNVSAATISRLI